MTTSILNQLSKDLAYKLQDPVTDGATMNGKRITKDERLGYLIRAYRRMTRLITNLHPQLLNKLSHILFSNISINSNSEGIITNTFNFEEIYEIFCKEVTHEAYTKAVFIEPDNYLSVKEGENNFYVPDLNLKNYYWSLIDGKVNILPATTWECRIKYRKPIAADLTYNGTQDINIPNEFIDLLLSLACLEAYMDIGQADMINVYNNDVQLQLGLLRAEKQEKDKKDETS